MYPYRKTLLLLAATMAGCQSVHRPAATRPAVAQNQSALPPAALLSLDEIQPAPTLSAVPARPTTRPAIDALLLFARAHDALLQNRGYAAVGLLERAVKIDPNSYDLYDELGRAYLSVGHSSDQAIDAFEKAAALRPTELSVHLQLARLYLLHGNLDDAIRHLRIGRLTEDYQQEEGAAAVTDLLLARALQQKGYIRAATDEYQKVLDDLQNSTSAMRGNMELEFLIEHPEVIEEQLGELAEMLGEDQAALEDYQKAAAVDEDNFDAQAHVVRILLKMGRADESAALAAKLVRQFQASPESMDVLREVYSQVGSRAGVIRELAKLHAGDPEDRTILFTLADALRTQGRQTEAETLLSDAAADDEYEPDVVQRLFQMRLADSDTDAAAKLLIEALAHRPDSLRQLVPLWSQLMAPTRSDRLRLSALQNLSVPAEAESAKLFWISTVAEVWNRGELAKDSLSQAVKEDKPFAPAYRLLLEQTWRRRDWSDTQKKKFSADLAERAQEHGDPALAAELRGISMLAQKNADEAAAAFERARQLGDNSPDLEISYASALMAQGKNAEAERALWKLVTDYPTCDDGYDALFRYYLSRKQPDEAMRVLRTWLDDAPMSTEAKLIQATVFFQTQRYDLADQALTALIDAHPEDSEVLQMAADIYQQTGQLSAYIKKLEALRADNPRNQVVVEELVDLYIQQHQLGEAERVLNATYAAVQNDPDLLYYLSHLYSEIGQQQQAEKLLGEVLKLDPTDTGAANDLGYSWADEGKNLNKAEALIRRAVRAEPDNESFLDSLGWVQYKRGEFSAALQSLQKAVANNPEPDPVVLNHLGDTYYRLGQKPEATKAWRQALVRLDQSNEDRQDIKDLRLTLPAKLKAADHGGKVEVAPTAMAAGRP
jgi:tetratricopeptide (TPR) repeat protein